MDREKVIKEKLDEMVELTRGLSYASFMTAVENATDILALLKEQKKKEIKLHKKHIITWKRDDEFTMRKLYEAVCEILLDEGELFIARTDDHEKVDFVFYVADGR